MKLTVACVYWEGTFRGREKIYNPQWVTKLRSMVAKHLKMAYRFECLTNVDIAGGTPLSDDLPGWWSKLELFRRDVFVTDYVLYLDLDTLIMRNLTPFLTQMASFVSVPQPKIFRRTSREGLQEIHRYNTSVMFWKQGSWVHRLYESFDRAKISEFRGDQDWISSYCERNRCDHGAFPSSWVTKLKDCPGRGREPHPDAKVILAMPGKNEKAAEQFEWVRKIWV